MKELYDIYYDEINSGCDSLLDLYKNKLSLLGNQDDLVDLIYFAVNKGLYLDVLYKCNLKLIKYEQVRENVIRYAVQNSCITGMSFDSLNFIKDNYLWIYNDEINKFCKSIFIDEINTKKDLRFLYSYVFTHIRNKWFLEKLVNYAIDFGEELGCLYFYSFFNLDKDARLKFIEKGLNKKEDEYALSQLYSLFSDEIECICDINYLGFDVRLLDL